MKRAKTLSLFLLLLFFMALFLDLYEMVTTDSKKRQPYKAPHGCRICSLTSSRASFNDLVSLVEEFGRQGHPLQCSSFLVDD